MRASRETGQTERAVLNKTGWMGGQKVLDFFDLTDIKSVALGRAPHLTPLQVEMTIKQERRDGSRAPSMWACPYELTKLEGSAAIKSSKGFGYSINMSPGGMLLLLPQKVGKRQVFEIQLPSEAKKKERTKLVEVRWTQPIPVSARTNMYLVGTRFLFETPAQ